MRNKCPWCNKPNFIEDVVYINVENYGSNKFHLPCTQCGEMVMVVARRKVEIIEIQKSLRSKSESDF